MLDLLVKRREMLVRLAKERAEAEAKAEFLRQKKSAKSMSRLLKLAPSPTSLRQ